MVIISPFQGEDGGSNPLTRSYFFYFYIFMTKKIKKSIFPGITFLTSFYLSSILTLGLFLGYLGTHIFCKKFIATKKVKLLIIPIGKGWKFHLHHWISGLLGLIILYLTDITHSYFYLGIMGGIAFHDLYTDPNWRQVIYKEK